MPRRYRVALQGFGSTESGALTLSLEFSTGRDLGYEEVADAAESDFLIADADAPEIADRVRAAGRLRDTVFVGERPVPGALSQVRRPIDADAIVQELDELRALREAEAMGVLVHVELPAAQAPGQSRVPPFDPAQAPPLKGPTSVERAFEASEVPLAPPQAAAPAPPPSPWLLSDDEALSFAPSTAGGPGEDVASPSQPGSASGTEPAAEPKLQRQSQPESQPQSQWRSQPQPQPEPGPDARPESEALPGWRQEAPSAPAFQGSSAAARDLPIPTAPVSIALRDAGAAGPLSAKAAARAAARRARLRQRPASGAGQAPPADVLVLDDSEIARRFLAKLLGDFGFRVEAVADSAELQRALATRPYSVVFLDVVLGPDDASDGIELCQGIRSIAWPPGHVAPRVMMVSGAARPSDEVRARLAGCDAFLRKPISRGSLARALEACGVELPSDARRA